MRKIIFYITKRIKDDTLGNAIAELNYDDKRDVKIAYKLAKKFVHNKYESHKLADKRRRSKEDQIAQDLAKKNSLGEMVENTVSNIAEGSWCLPDTEGKIRELEKIMSKPLDVGANGDNAINALKDVIGNDEVFDDLIAASKKDSESDGRKQIAEWITSKSGINRYMMPAHLKEKVIKIANEYKEKAGNKLGESQINEDQVNEDQANENSYHVQFREYFENMISEASKSAMDSVPSYSNRQEVSDEKGIVSVVFKNDTPIEKIFVEYLFSRQLVSRVGSSGMMGGSYSVEVCKLLPELGEICNGSIDLQREAAKWITSKFDNHNIMVIDVTSHDFTDTNESQINENLRSGSLEHDRDIIGDENYTSPYPEKFLEDHFPIWSKTNPETDKYAEILFESNSSTTRRYGLLRVRVQNNADARSNDGRVRADAIKSIPCYSTDEAKAFATEFLNNDRHAHDMVAEWYANEGKGAWRADESQTNENLSNKDFWSHLANRTVDNQEQMINEIRKRAGLETKIITESKEVAEPKSKPTKEITSNEVNEVRRRAGLEVKKNTNETKGHVELKPDADLDFIEEVDNAQTRKYAKINRLIDNGKEDFVVHFNHYDKGLGGHRYFATEMEAHKAAKDWNNSPKGFVAWCNHNKCGSDKPIPVPVDESSINESSESYSVLDFVFKEFSRTRAAKVVYYGENTAGKNVFGVNVYATPDNLSDVNWIGNEGDTSIEFFMTNEREAVRSAKEFMEGTESKEEWATRIKSTLKSIMWDNTNEEVVNKKEPVESIKEVEKEPIKESNNIDNIADQYVNNSPAPIVQTQNTLAEDKMQKFQDRMNKMDENIGNDTDYLKKLAGIKPVKKMVSASKSDYYKELAGIKPSQPAIQVNEGVANPVLDIPTIAPSINDFMNVTNPAPVNENINNNDPDYVKKLAGIIPTKKSIETNQQKDYYKQLAGITESKKK